MGNLVLSEDYKLRVKDGARIGKTPTEHFSWIYKKSPDIIRFRFRLFSEVFRETRDDGRLVWKLVVFWGGGIQRFLIILKTARRTANILDVFGIFLDSKGFAGGGVRGAAKIKKKVWSASVSVV